MKFFHKLLIAVMASVLSLGIISFAVACAPSEEEPKTVDYTITVTCDDAAVLNSVKVKLTKGGTNAADPKALTNGKATFTLAPDSYTVELDGLSEDYTYTKGSVTATKLDATIAVTKKSVEPETPEEVDYVITVTCEDELTNVKVQLKKDGTAFGEAQDLTDGKATFHVEKGNYTAELVGLSDEYEYTPATLSETVLQATITVTKKAVEPETPEEVDYVITVECDEELEGVQVQLKKDGEAFGEAQDLTDGKATFHVEKGNYTAELVGLGDEYEYTPATLSETVLEATITVTKKAVEPEIEHEAFLGTWVSSDGTGTYKVEITETELKFYQEGEEIPVKDIVFGAEEITFSIEENLLGQVTVTDYYLRFKDDGLLELGTIYEDEYIENDTLSKEEGGEEENPDGDLPEGLDGEWRSGDVVLTIDGSDLTMVNNSVTMTGTIVSCKENYNEGFYDMTFEFDESYLSAVYNSLSGSLTVYMEDETELTFSKFVADFTLPEGLQGTFENEDYGTLTIEEKSVTFERTDNLTPYTMEGEIVSYDETTGEFQVEFDGEDPQTLTFKYVAEDGSIDWYGDVFTKVESGLEIPEEIQGEWTGSSLSSMTITGDKVVMNFSVVEYTITSVTKTDTGYDMTITGSDGTFSLVYNAEEDTLDFDDGEFVFHR